MPHIVSHTYRACQATLSGVAFVSAACIIGGMSLGERIRAARLGLKISQQAIAKKFEISRAAVAQWESGETRPDQSRLVELAGMLNMDVSDLLGDVPRQYRPKVDVELTPDEKQTLEFSDYLPPDRLSMLIEQVRLEAAQKSALLAALLAKQREDEGRAPPPKEVEETPEWPKFKDRRKNNVKISFPERRLQPNAEKAK